jgi:hypothetical protein
MKWISMPPAIPSREMGLDKRPPNGGRVTVMETVGGPIGSTTIHNPSNNHRRMVSQRIGEGLVGNVDLVMQMYTVHRSKFVGVQVAKTRSESSESFGVLKL